MKILIVDDKEEERYLAETLLKGRGYEVISTTNGAEALEKLRAEGFDMIVSDILMPVMDGFQLCRECKGNEKLKDIPFVFYTAEYIEEEDENLALKLGADKFIQKPIESDEFIKLIQGVFRDLEEAKKKPVVAGMRILVVEDNEDSRNLLVKQLRAYGHEVTSVTNGAEALQQALVQPPDVIVSDILMPKMDGYQLCRECKLNEQLKNIPFVFYTATYTLDEDRKFALSLGANTFIRKPTEPDSLVQTLCEIFEKAKSGALAPTEVVPLEPSLYLTEYTKRIVAKLEDKVAQLEIEITERRKAEEALQIAEQNFRNSLDNSPLGIRIITVEGELLYANQAILDIYGYGSVEELKAMPAKQRYTPESYAEHQERKERRKLGKPVLSSYEISIVRKDGEVRHLIVSRKEVVWGGETQYQAIYQDITERRKAEHDLNERVKELQCLYGIANIAERPGITLDELYQEVVNILPAGWQYPEIACCRITINDKEFRTNNYKETEWKQSADIKVHDAKIGKVEANYLEERPELDEGPFLKEERLLINAVAERLGRITERKLAEEALRESEEKYRTLTENVNIGIYRVTPGPKGNFIEVNPALVKILGYKNKKEVLSINVADIYQNPKKRKKFSDKVIRQGFATGEELQLKKRDGTPIIASVSAIIVRAGGKAAGRDDAGNILYFDGILEDITERKQAEETVRESEEKYRQLFELGSDALFLIEVKTGKILDLNNAAIEMYGYSREEALQMKNTDFSAEPDKTRKATLESEKHIPVRYHRKKDGTIFPTDISVAYYTWYGKEVCVAAIRDTTERKKAEDDLKRAAEEWRTTFDSITDLVSICNKDFRLVRVNKAFADFFKMKPEELIGKHCYEIVHGTNEPIPHCPHKQTIKTKKPAVAEFFEPHLGIHLEVMTSPIFNEEGEVVACVHVTRDITERKKMEEQLMVTDRLASIGELASGIAHELNNPLTSVIGFSELLLGKKGLPSDVKEDLRVVNREAQRTASVVRNLLVFARKHAPTKEPVAINNLIQKVLELRAYEQKVNNLQVNTRFAPNLPEITGDGFQLQQVFLNIIINAEHFMSEAHKRGTLTITTERAGDIIQASFADDGPGIAKENLGHVFDPFFTTKEVGKGTGLGLSISYGIITEHGGRIYAESKLGKGATFIVELPVSQQ